ncbi:type 2 periplasmic-binding domain-containing protein [Endozoicomonas elysicola]|nr:hypothetical protein [Endozoicomonas elysicola]
MYNVQLALIGAGITQLPIWMMKDDLESGSLVQVLCDYQADNIPFHAMYP